MYSEYLRSSCLSFSWKLLLPFSCYSRSNLNCSCFYLLSCFCIYFWRLNYSACWLYIMAHSCFFGSRKRADYLRVLGRLVGDISAGTNIWDCIIIKLSIVLQLRFRHPITNLRLILSSKSISRHNSSWAVAGQLDLDLSLSNFDWWLCSLEILLFFDWSCFWGWGKRRLLLSTSSRI